jgi:hypothetical protein
MNQVSYIFKRTTKASNSTYISHDIDKDLDYFFDLSKKTIISREKIGHDMLELEGYLDCLKFQEAEVKAKLQLALACRKVLEKKFGRPAGRECDFKPGAGS